VAESVFGSGSVEMSATWDHQGADIRVTYNRKHINIQVKKETKSREVRIEKTHSKKLDGISRTVHYFVPNMDIIRSPKKKNGQFKKAYKTFHAAYLKKKLLRVLPNGFVIFEKPMFRQLKQS
jgi:hypothetical protein